MYNILKEENILNIGLYLQDSHGRTPLAQAILLGKNPAIIQMLASSGRINWNLKDRGGFNVLDLIVIKNDLK